MQNIGKTHQTTFTFITHHNSFLKKKKKNQNLKNTEQKQKQQKQKQNFLFQ
jgi:hypothetical protein